MIEQSLHAWQRNPVAAHQAWRASARIAGREYADQVWRCTRPCGGGFAGGWQHSVCTRWRSVGSTSSLSWRACAAAATSPASVRTQRTYLAEIHRVQAHLVSLGARTTNPAADLMRQARLRQTLRPRSIWLPSPQTRAALATRLSTPEGVEDASGRTYERDAAMVALMWCCGLTLKEIQKLRLQHLRVNESAGQLTVHAAVTVPCWHGTSRWTCRM